MSSMEELQARLWSLIWANAGEAIEKVLQEAWRDGYAHGSADKLEKEREVKHELSGMD